MDPFVVKELAPMLAVLICGAIPVSIVAFIQHYKHKREELQLERDLRMASLANERLALEVKMKQLELMGKGAGAQGPLPAATAEEAMALGARKPTLG